jgi:hypothetical protein
VPERCDGETGQVVVHRADMTDISKIKITSQVKQSNGDPSRLPSPLGYVLPHIHHYTIR